MIRMKRLVACVLVLGTMAEAFAMRHVGFETDAFNRAYPVSYAKDMVFSPASFEIDCVLYAQTLDTLSKARVAERMGIVLGFESVYRPILAALSSRTNGISFLAARGFCVPRMKAISPAFRLQFARDFGGIFCEIYPTKGAEAWFKAEMEGEMEDFRVAVDAARDSRYAYYDLVSARFPWEEPFPAANTRTMPFEDAKGDRRNIPFMRDVRVGATWDTPEYVLLKLPMAGGNEFYAMMPTKGSDLGAVKGDISSIEIDTLLSVTKSVTEKGVFNGSLEVALPKMNFFSRLNLGGVMAYFGVPTTGLQKLPGVTGAHEVVQQVKFVLDEGGVRPRTEEPPRAVRRIAFDRPFLFFIYNEPTATIPVAGQFTGVGG